MTRPHSSLTALVLLITLALGATQAWADLSASLRAAPVIPAGSVDELKRHVGETVIVEGTVAWARWSASGKVMHLLFDDAEESEFGVAFFARNRDRFDAGFGGDVTRALQGSTIRVKGQLQPYGGHDERLAESGRVEILLNWPNQLTILELGSPMKAASPAGR